MSFEAANIAPQNTPVPAGAVMVSAAQNNIIQKTASKSAISPLWVQPKLTVGTSDDPYEKEADAMADQVMRMPETGFIQRKCTGCEEEEKISRKPLSLNPFIQTKSEGNVSASEDITSSINLSRGSGSALDGRTQPFMSSRFGNDFSDVKIHTDSQSAQLNRDLNAKAFTVGNDVFFNDGQYRPESVEGKKLLAHELTHTVQQGGPIELQRSCSDGKCDTWSGGKKEFWITAYFRREINEATLKKLDKEVAVAKTVFANCCLDLKMEINKDRVAGSSSMNAYTPATSTDRWRYTADETAIGTGKTFDKAKGIPMLVVDDVPLSGGGVTVDKKFDDKYSGKQYFILGLNQTSTPNPNCNHLAHELWHVGGTDIHDPANGPITACTGNGVSDKYCNNLRALT